MRQKINAESLSLPSPAHKHHDLMLSLFVCASILTCQIPLLGVSAPLLLTPSIWHSQTLWLRDCFTSPSPGRTASKSNFPLKHFWIELLSGWGHRVKNQFNWMVTSNKIFSGSTDGVSGKHVIYHPQLLGNPDSCQKSAPVFARRPIPLTREVFQSGF